MAYTVSRSIDVTLLYSLEMLAVILEQSITYQTKFRCFAHSTICIRFTQGYPTPPGVYLCLRDVFVWVLVFGRRKNTLYLLWIPHTWSISCFWCQGCLHVSRQFNHPCLHFFLITVKKGEKLSSLVNETFGKNIMRLNCVNSFVRL